MSKKKKSDKKKKADKRKKANKQKKSSKKKIIEKVDEAQSSVTVVKDDKAEKVESVEMSSDTAAKRNDTTKRVDPDKIKEILAAAKDAKGNFDLDNSSALNREQKRVNVDFPQWMIAGLDDEAQRLGINRQAVIKTWIAERLDAKFS